MKISYHGHSIVYVQTKTHNILVDPFITGNELTDLDADTVEADVIILTHGHEDHLGDTISIAKRTGAQVVAINELAVYLSGKGLEAHGMNIGGGYAFAKRTGAQVVAINELAVYLSGKGLEAHGMNIGGGYAFDFGHVKYTQA